MLRTLSFTRLKIRCSGKTELFTNIVFPLTEEALLDPNQGGVRDGSNFLGPHGWRLGKTLVRYLT
jgi:hypothetical protein